MTEATTHPSTATPPATPISPVHVTVWGENRHEQQEPHVAAIYPQGMHTTIAEGIEQGLADVEAGRLVPHEEAMAELYAVVDGASGGEAGGEAAGRPA